MAKIWSQPKCPLIDSNSVIGKAEILPFSTPWMDLENIMRSEISQIEEGKSHMISLNVGYKTESNI